MVIFSFAILGSILVSTRRLASIIRYKGDVCAFLNQSQTNINANTTALTNFKNAFASLKFNRVAA